MRDNLIALLLGFMFATVFLDCRASAAPDDLGRITNALERIARAQERCK
jgi:hypothetical protein